MPVRKLKPVEANDGTYGGMVLAAFDAMERKMIRVSLNNSGGELDAAEIVPLNDDQDELSQSIHDAIARWTLAPGDTIKIEEQE